MRNLSVTGGEKEASQASLVTWVILVGAWLLFEGENTAKPPHHGEGESVAGISGNVVFVRAMVILQGESHYGPLHDIEEESAAGIPDSVGDGWNMVIFQGENHWRTPSPRGKRKHCRHPW